MFLSLRTEGLKYKVQEGMFLRAKQRVLKLIYNENNNY